MDVFGKAFRDYLDGDSKAVIRVYLDVSEPDDLPVSYFFRTYKEMPLWEQMALDACRGRVLDVGAGAGAHALDLQQRGLEVVAIDLSPGAVDIMKARGVKNAICQDFFVFGEKSFDTVLFLMNGAGMATNLEGLQQLFRHTKKWMNPGGQILVESTDLIYLFEEEDGSYSIPLGERYYGEVVYQLEYKGRRGESFHWLFVDPDNLSDAAEREGFSVDFLFLGEDHNYVARLILETKA
ncbi:MAG: class I SAM-dependent methyltransferase [Bacteroidales bacterium]|nr:class I SAM-dependent methyltransferase [Bacteroidales bacterium]NLM93914.1 class I SAM-dependent methyltransferase [Bacteroidales bacterium]